MNKEKEPLPTIPQPIHFKSLKVDENIPLIPEPIHFKQKTATTPQSNNKKSILKIIKEAVNDIKIKHQHSDWLIYNNNSHLGRYGHQISKKLNDGQKLDKNEKDNIHSYTVNSTSLNKHLIKTKGKPTNKQHADHTNTLSASIQKNKIKHDLHTYSGVTFDPEKIINKQKKMKSAAFISTTHNKSTALTFELYVEYEFPS